MKTYIQIITILLLLPATLMLAQQEPFTGKVIDKKNNEPLQYSHIVIKGLSKGTITNEDGDFRINANRQKDTLLFSYLGYVNYEIPCNNFPKDGIIKLKPQDNILREVTVLGENNFIYKLIVLAAKKLRKDRIIHSSKAFLSLESTVGKNPLEVIQSYFNADFNNHKIENLKLKNGRIGMAPFCDSYFVSLSTTNILKSYDIIDQNYDDILPANPLQFTYAQLKKTYTLNLFETITDENGNEIYHIKFKPKSGNFLFSGSAYINPKTHILHKLSIYSNYVEKAPFIPIKSTHKIDSLSMKIDYTFMFDENIYLLNNIHFSFLFNYIKQENTNLINTNGIVYFYDTNRKFYDPYFNDKGSISDYQKIVSVPFNKTFWEINNAILSSDKIKRHVKFFEDHGTLLNFDNIQEHSGLLKPMKQVWSEKRRISVDEIKENANTYQFNSSKGTPQLNIYNLHGQIFMDVNRSGDSFIPFTKTIIDLDESYYLYPSNDYTNCFINNYFDIIEISRRELNKKFSKAGLRLSTIRDLYNETNTKLEIELKRYLRETERGTKYEKLIEWSQYVANKLGIDNTELIIKSNESGIKKVTTNMEKRISIEAYNLGTAFLKNENYEEAVKHFSTSIEYDNTNHLTYYNRSIAYKNMGEKELACKDIQMAIDLGDQDAINLKSEICDN